MQLLRLDGDIEPNDVEGQLLKVRQHDVVKGAYIYEFLVKKKNLSIVAIGGKLQEVTYNCGSVFPWIKSRNRQQLLALYDIDNDWVKVFDNEIGSMFQNQQETHYATWEHKSNTISFGVMLFREEMQRAIN